MGKEDIEKECHALGISIESGQSFPPQIRLIGHVPLPTQKLTDLFELAEYLRKLAEERSDFFDSEPETWWGKLSEQGKQNAEELFLTIWEGYNRSKQAAFRAIISARCLEVSPALLRGGWYSDAEAKQILRLISLLIAGLFDHERVTASDIVELLFKGMQSFVDFGKQLQDQLDADVDSLQAFADFLAGRSATYTDALLDFYFAHAPSAALERVFTEMLEKSARNVLVSPSLDPPYPKGVARLHALAHRFANEPDETDKIIDEQMRKFIGRRVLEERKYNPYYQSPRLQVTSVIGHDPYKALLLSLLAESKSSGTPVTELAQMLHLEPIKTSKEVSRLKSELRSAYGKEDPLLTFLRKIGYA